MAYTGGHLNELNGKMGISAPYRSVPIMKLIRTHQPKSKEALVDLIKYHFDNDCKCGIKSQGTIEDFGRNLFISQQKHWGEVRYSLKECIQWENDLFVIQSLKGGIIEKKALRILQEKLQNYTFEEAEGYLDEELRIDLIIKKTGNAIAGVQVKPATFKRMRAGIITFNKEANKKWSNPVFYLYYDRSENFENMEELISEITKL